MNDLADKAVQPEGLFSGFVVEGVQNGNVVKNGEAVRKIRLLGIIGE